MNCDTFTIIDSISSAISSFIALGALIYTIYEYKLHKDGRRAEILSNYNTRYSSDVYIKRVIKFLHNNSEIPKRTATEIKEIFDRNKIINLNDLEMFMRFFEELQYAIERKSLSKEIVYDMFAYYALEAKPLLENCTEDYNGDGWRRFRTFVKDMECIRKERNKK